MLFSLILAKIQKFNNIPCEWDCWETSNLSVSGGSANGTILGGDCVAISMQYISQILSLFKPILLILEIHLTEVSAQLGTYVELTV